ncbi:MAG: nuclease [Rhodospirillaceae bacterium]|nr:nuclease [Rhodospirillaceae bacterium]MBT5373961.1 nuclease [Rhodospirillaceae bacterium]MBT5658517.1 nuclease [Rhodospirillaceae bacterium]MBT5751291.1 nuclease [Rhodospirillaceae bacterium]MBT7943948.1 nuclease [Alphaproteobacteria bacterium]
MFLAAAFIPLTSKSDVLMGPVPAQVLEIIDGDTLKVRARIWLGQDVDISVRLVDVDAPELRGRCERERQLAQNARHLVESLVAGRPVILHDIRYGKYAGRVLARITTEDGEDLAARLIAAGLGRPYGGAARRGWCS